MSTKQGSDAPARRFARWVLLYGDRRTLTLVLLTVILTLLIGVGTVWEFQMERLVTETRAVQTLFNTLLGGVILFVSVVLSINTAALAQEFTPLQVKLTRIEDSIRFQSELEELVGEGVSPAQLRPFLQYVIDAIRAETESLAATDADGRAREDVIAFVDDVDDHLSVIETRLRRTDPRLSVVLLSSLDYPYALHINRARRVSAVHSDALPEDDSESLGSVLRTLTVLASGREYFTTLYFKRELRNLSASLLVLSLPVIVFTSYVLLALDAGVFPGLALPAIESRLLYVVFAFVVALSPYVLLSSYMLRILTVSKHSLESTVFTLDPDDDFD